MRLSAMGMGLDRPGNKKSAPDLGKLLQQLTGNVQPDGSIRDARGSLVAKAVEQPAGVSAGSGTLTFSEDIDSVDSFGKAGTGTATINGSNAKQLDLSADTFWDIQLTVDGKSVFIADPYTGYDCQGNYDGTPANITSGTQSETAKLQNIGFNRWFKDSTSLEISTLNPSDKGEYVFGIVPRLTSIERVNFATDVLSKSYLDSRYNISFATNGTISLLRKDSAVITASSAGAIVADTAYYVRILWTGTTFSLYVMGGDYGWVSWTLIGTDTDVNYSTGKYLTVDLVSNTKFQPLYHIDSNGNKYWYTDFIEDWKTISNSPENHIVPADLSNPGYDVLGTPLRYGEAGIKPLGSINFDPASSGAVALDIFNTANVLWQAKEYYRTHILTAGIAASGYTHKLRYLKSNSYYRCLGLINLINRLYMKEHIANGDWTAIKQFLNYETELTDAEKARVYSYLKDPTKTNLEEWDEFQDGTVVAAWRFDEPLSLLNNDGQLADLGWEGEDIPRSLSQTTGSGATINGDEITLVDEIAIIKNLNYWETGQTYEIDCTVEDYVGSGNIVLPYDQTDASSDAVVSGNGNYVYRYTPDSSTTMIIYSASGHTAKVTINSIKPIGGLVNTVKDVGSGNGTDTYYDLTQTDMSLQPKRIPGGIDFMDDDHELEHDAALNGKVAYVTEMDGTTGVTFDLAGGKLTGALLYSEIVAYKVKSIIVKDY